MPRISTAWFHNCGGLVVRPNNGLYVISSNIGPTMQGSTTWSISRSTAAAVDITAHRYFSDLGIKGLQTSLLVQQSYKNTRKNNIFASMNYRGQLIFNSRCITRCVSRIDTSLKSVNSNMNASPKKPFISLKPNKYLIFKGVYPFLTTTSIVGNKTTTSFQITNVSKNPIAYKVKTTVPASYNVKPTSGIIEPDGNQEVLSE